MCIYVYTHYIIMYIYIHDYMNYMYMDTCIHLHVVCIIMCVYTLFLLILLYSCISIEHWCHMLSHVVTSGKHSPFTGLCNVTSLVRGLTGLSPKMTATCWTKMTCSPCDAANLASQNVSIFESLLMFVKFGSARPHLRIVIELLSILSD